jgi:hypothetical protein
MLMNDERKRQLDSIRETARRLELVSRQFNSLRWKAENDASCAFIDLANSAGKMIVGSLEQTGALLEILFHLDTEKDHGRHRSENDAGTQPMGAVANSQPRERANEGSVLD